MIIEAGYDLSELFAPKVLVRRSAKRRQRVWVLAMDENLRNLCSSFRDYFGYEHLPRVAFIPGPHDHPCNCLACAQREVRRQRGWERNHDSQQLDSEHPGSASG